MRNWSALSKSVSVHMLEKCRHFVSPKTLLHFRVRARISENSFSLILALIVFSSKYKRSIEIKRKKINNAYAIIFLSF